MTGWQRWRRLHPSEVVAIDMAQLAVAARIETGAGPMGLVLLDAAG